MVEVVVSGLVTGWAIAIPIGAVGAFLVTLTARYFAAVVLGNRHLVSTPGEGVVFVLAAFLASASWQLVLAGGGTALGRVSTGHRSHLVTGLVSAAVIAALAVRTMLG